MRLYSWNVNGIRAAFKRGSLDWILRERPDVVCLQETRALVGQLPKELTQPGGYSSYSACAERAGYSGVTTYSRTPACSWRAKLGVEPGDGEGRLLRTDHGWFDLYNVYFPNGKASAERLAYKLRFYRRFLAHVDRRARAGRPIVFCGDTNTAHRPIDLARPKENETVSGFLPEERAWLDRWLDHGWVDVFRHLHPDERDAYTWWSTRTNARARNVGWRLDYFFVHETLLGRVRGAGIRADIMGSDHCPVWIDLED